MPNNEIFQIDKFQMKICNEWETAQKTYIPKWGEPVYVTTKVASLYAPILVIGDEANTLEGLISRGQYYINKQMIPKADNEGLTPVTTNGVESPGIAATFARSDHKHTLDKKITSGTSLPNNANNGDIFILIEDNA